MITANHNNLLWNQKYNSLIEAPQPFQAHVF